MTPLSILDTTLLSNFSHLQQPDLVRLALGDQIATTPKALAELRTGEAEGLVPTCDWTWLTVVQLDSAEQRLAADLSRQLGPGEAECLAVSIKRHVKFLSDDLAARQLAKKHGVPVSGTLGVLLVLVDEKHLQLEEADALLERLIISGYHSPVKSLRDLLL